MAGEMLVLHDEGRAKIVLDKIRSSCEGVLLAAQESISRDLALRFEQLESTLSRALNDAMRPIEQRVKRGAKPRRFSCADPFSSVPYSDV